MPFELWLSRAVVILFGTTNQLHKYWSILPSLLATMSSKYWHMMDCHRVYVHSGGHQIHGIARKGTSAIVLFKTLSLTEKYVKVDNDHMKSVGIPSINGQTNWYDFLYHPSVTCHSESYSHSISYFV
jgi:hypothetical protein